jgi:hypothetical protein
MASGFLGGSCDARGRPRSPKPPAGQIPEKPEYRKDSAGRDTRAKPRAEPTGTTGARHDAQQSADDAC